VVVGVGGGEWLERCMIASTDTLEPRARKRFTRSVHEMGPQIYFFSTAQFTDIERN
jgi:hypothetical protein